VVEGESKVSWIKPKLVARIWYSAKTEDNMRFNSKYKFDLRGWWKDSWRHSQAAKGIKTKPRRYQYRVEKHPFNKHLRIHEGKTQIVEIDAKEFADKFKKSQGEDLAWSKDRLESARGREVVDSYPKVIFYPDGRVDVVDGRHRLAVAAEKGLKVPVVIDEDSRKYMFYKPSDFPLIAGDVVGTTGAATVSMIPIAIPLGVAAGAIYCGSKVIKKHRKVKPKYQMAWRREKPIQEKDINQRIHFKDAQNEI
jgi:hypothetical protein